MSAENVDNPPVYYEQLDDIEDDFEQVDLEIRKFIFSCSPFPSSADPPPPFFFVAMRRIGDELSDSVLDRQSACNKPPPPCPSKNLAY